MSTSSWYREIRDGVVGSAGDASDLGGVRGATRTSRSRLSAGVARAGAMVVFAFGVATGGAITTGGLLPADTANVRATRDFTVVGGGEEHRSPEVAAAIERWREGIPARLRLVDTLFGDDSDEYVDVPFEV